MNVHSSLTFISPTLALFIFELALIENEKGESSDAEQDLRLRDRRRGKISLERIEREPASILVAAEDVANDMTMNE